MKKLTYITPILLLLLCGIPRMVLAQNVPDSSSVKQDSVPASKGKLDPGQAVEKLLVKKGGDSLSRVKTDTIVQKTLRKIESALQTGELPGLEEKDAGRSLRDISFGSLLDSTAVKRDVGEDSAVFDAKGLESLLKEGTKLDEVLDDPLQGISVLERAARMDSLELTNDGGIDKVFESSANDLDKKLDFIDSQLGSLEKVSVGIDQVNASSLNKKPNENLSRKLNLNEDLENEIRTSTSVAKVNERYIRMQSTASYVERRFKNKYMNSHLLDHKLTRDSVEQMRDQAQEQLSAYDHYMTPSVSMYTVKDSLVQQLDSLAPDLPLREKVVNRHDSIRSIIYKKRSFLNLDYFQEFIAGIYPSEDQELTLNPNVGFALGPRFDAGLGPSIHLRYERQLRANIGLRSFVRWNWLPNLYAQGESTHYFRKLSNGSFESAQETPTNTPSVAVGLGYMPSLTERLGVVIQLLYEVVESDAFDVSSSPWIVRFGINY